MWTKWSFTLLHEMAHLLLECRQAWATFDLGSHNEDER